MKKDMMRYCGGLGIVLVLYILVAFLIPFPKTGTFWLAFVFTLIAFAVMAYTIYLAFLKNPDAKSRFYGFPIAKIGVIYAVVQVVLSLIFMALGRWVPVWVTILICAIALGAALLGLISAEAVVEEIKVQDVKLKKDVSLMRGLQSKLSTLGDMCADVETADMVKKLAEDVRYSDPVSAESLSEIEQLLSMEIGALVDAVTESDYEAAKKWCRKATVSLTERNRLCKLNK